MIVVSTFLYMNTKCKPFMGFFTGPTICTPSLYLHVIIASGILNEKRKHVRPTTEEVPRPYNQKDRKNCRAVAWTR